MLLQIAGAFGTFQASSCIVARKGTVLDPDELDLVTLEVLAARDLSEDGDLVTVARVRGVDGAVRVVAPQDPDVQERVDAQYFVPIPSTSDVLIFTFEMRLGLQRDDALRLFDAIVDTLRFIDGTRLRGEGDADG